MTADIPGSSVQNKLSHPRSLSKVFSYYPEAG